MAIVRRILQELHAQVGGIRTERQHVAVGVLRVRLMKDALARRQVDRPRVCEAAHPAQRFEILIERSVLLHQEDHVFYVMDASRSMVGRNGHSAADACRKCGGSCRCGQQLQEFSTVGAHAEFHLSWITLAALRAAAYSPLIATA